MNPAQIQRLLADALSHHQGGRLAAADTIYRQVIRNAPGNFDALHLAGVVALQQNHPADAIPFLRSALRINPRHGVCAMRLAIGLNATGKFEEAERHLRTALQLEPKLGEAWFHLAMVLRSLGKTTESLEAAAKSVQLKPEFAEAHDLLGSITVLLKGYAAGEPHFRAAVRLAPKYALAWCNLGLTLNQLGKLREAAEALTRAIDCDPKLARAHAGLGVVWERHYRLADAITCYRNAIAVDPKLPDAWSCMLLGMHYLPDVSRESLWREHQAYGRVFVAEDKSQRFQQASPATGNAPAAPCSGSRSLPVAKWPDRPLKIGFLSPDFRAHSVAYFLEPLLAHLDRSRFRIELYYDYNIDDWMTERLRSLADGWHPVAGMLSDTLAKMIADDKLDVIVELSGHTGYNRLPIFARRLAPVQVTYLGYPNTTGLPTIDFRLTDEIADPEGEADAFNAERLVRFSSTAWCYSPPKQAPDVAEPPSVARGIAPTFGCFNNVAKINEPTLVRWASILQRIPGARLLLKGHGLGETELQETLLARLANAGFSQGSVVLLERTKTLAEHLSLYAQVDVALDTFPYNGTTTTCEALWMGVPVISLAGDRHSSRVGLSLLSAAGHRELVADSWDEYCDRAARLAVDAPELVRLRGALRGALHRSQLLDHASQAARFGEALLRMWLDKTG